VKLVRFVVLVDSVILLAAVLVASCVVTQPMGGSAGSSPSAVADPARLEASVRALVERFRPRDAAHVAELDAAAGWLRDELERTGARVSEQTWVTDGETYRNVSARFGPESGERVVVGAHYDVCDPLPGADDDASGVAGLLELARLLGSAPPAGEVELVAYSLEEPPYFATLEMGSAHHAESLARAPCSRSRCSATSATPPAVSHTRRSFSAGSTPSAGTSSRWSEPRPGITHQAREARDARSGDGPGRVDQRPRMARRSRSLRSPQLLGTGLPQR
jgi:hypothetical protein